MHVTVADKPALASSNNFASLIWEYFIYFHKYQGFKSALCARSSRSDLLGTERGLEQMDDR